MTETDHFESGLATLSKDPKPDFPDKSPWSVNGVAIPVNTVVNGGQGVDHFFPEESLEGNAELLEGRPIVKNFHELDGQASADQVIGEVTSAAYEKGVGLVFEGEITDPDIAQKIKQGYLDVSPTPARSLGEFDESMGAQRVERLADFRDLAVVANGQPGAKVEMGTNPAVEALSHDVLNQMFDTLQEDVNLVPPQEAAENARRGLECVEEVDTDAGEAQGRDTAQLIIDAVENDEPISEDMVGEIASFDRHREQGNHTVSEEFEGTPCEDNGFVSWMLWGGDAGVDWAQRVNDEMDTNANDTLQEDMKTVAGVRFQGTRDGKLDESEIDDNFGDHALYGEGENKEDYSYWVVDAEGFLRKGNVESAHSLGCRGQCPGEDEHDENLMQLAQEFDNPPEFAEENDSMASDMDMLQTDGDITVRQFRDFAMSLRDMDDVDPEWVNSVEAVAQQAANLQTIMENLVEHHATMHGMDSQSGHMEDETMSIVTEVPVEANPNEVEVITNE